MNKDIEEFTKNTGLPVGVELEESIPVKKMRYDKETGKVSSITELEKIKTTYFHAPKERIRCAPGQHFFEVADTHKWIFSCKNCNFSRRVFPHLYVFKDNKLISKRTGLPV